MRLAKLLTVVARLSSFRQSIGMFTSISQQVQSRGRWCSLGPASGFVWIDRYWGVFYPKPGSQFKKEKKSLGVKYTSIHSNTLLFKQALMWNETEPIRLHAVRKAHSRLTIRGTSKGNYNNA
jgi:hypothetical protein